MSVEKVAIITAGGSGMGAAAAHRLAARTASCVAVLSSSGKGEALGTRTGRHRRHRFQPIRTSDLKRSGRSAMARWGRIDVLVNSAGHGPRAADPRDLRRGLAQGHGRLSDERRARGPAVVAPIMQAQKSGTIINISTAWAFEPSGQFPTSAVFRAGLAAYTKIFADTYAADNIRMNNSNT